MNKAQIATIERLRHEGKGLSAIAKETGISINTIKSHFSRHGISAPRRIRTCLLCHSEIKTSKHFCSDTCRAAWYESHRDEAQDIPHWPGLRPALLKASLQHHFTGNYTLNVGILRFAQAKCLPFGAILFTLNRVL